MIPNQESQYHLSAGMFVQHLMLQSCNRSGRNDSLGEEDFFSEEEMGKVLQKCTHGSMVKQVGSVREFT